MTTTATAQATAAQDQSKFFDSVESIKAYGRMYEFSEWLNTQISKQERSWMLGNCKPESKSILNDVVKYDKWPEEKRGNMSKALRAAYPEENAFKMIIRGEYQRIQEEMKLLGRFPARTPDSLKG